MNIRHRMLRASLTAMLALSSVLLTAPFAAASSQSTAAVSAAVLRDAEIYAKYEGVTVQEAVRRFHLIDVAHPLHSELILKEAATFGDGWIENGPQFKFVLQFTQNGEQTMQPYILRYPELAPYIEIRGASITRRDLMEEQDKVASAIEHLGIPTDSEPDIKTGRITIYVTDQSALTQAIRNGFLSLPGNVDIVPVPMLSPPCDVIGGHGISAAGWSATTGFGAVDGTTRVITTAGHFAYRTNRVNALYDGSITLYYYSDGYDYGEDIAWYNPPSGYTVTNVIQDSQTTTRGIAWVEAYSSILIGEYVYKYGLGNGNTVGQVSVVGYRHTGYNYYVRVDTISGQPLCIEGDSGGPCYRGSTAIGTVVSYASDDNPDVNDMIIYPVSKLSSDFGVDVLTSP